MNTIKNTIQRRKKQETKKVLLENIFPHIFLNCLFINSKNI